MYICGLLRFWLSSVLLRKCWFIEGIFFLKQNETGHFEKIICSLLKNDKFKWIFLYLGKHNVITPFVLWTSKRKPAKYLKADKYLKVDTWWVGKVQLFWVYELINSRTPLSPFLWKLSAFVEWSIKLPRTTSLRTQVFGTLFWPKQWKSEISLLEEWSGVCSQLSTRFIK